MDNKGVYLITNQANNKKYIGSSVNLAKRQRQHLLSLQRGIHFNNYLQRAFVKYGENAFIFKVLEYVEDSQKIIERGQYYIDILKPAYNICLTVGSRLGVKHTKKTKQRLKETSTGNINGLGWNPSKETRQKMSESHKGIKLSEEHKRKIGEALKGRKSPMLGRKHSEKTKQKISELTKGSNNPNAKLTELQVLEIYQLAREKRLRQSVIAANYGINIGTVRHISAGQIWKHIIKKDSKKGE